MNYFEDLAGTIGGLYLASSLVEGVYDGVLSHRPVARVQRRRPESDEVSALNRALRKSWGTLRRLELEVADPNNYDEEANA